MAAGVRIILGASSGAAQNEVMKTTRFITSIDGLVAEYREHLLCNGGLTCSTCGVRTHYVRAFLNALFQAKVRTLNLQRITAQVLLDYVVEQSRRWCPSTVQSLATSLRSFLRFLRMKGRTSGDLGRAIPTVRSHSRERFPSPLSYQELEQLLRSCGGSRPTEKRARAVLLCLARLGLRVGEVAELRLEDVDWRASTLRLPQTKGRRERQLPFSSEVGQALVEYLKRGRPTTCARTVFVSLSQGRPLSADGISAIVHRAFKRVGIRGRSGGHRLRHTLASHLVQRGVSLKAVADLLGHSDLATTQIYAKVNLPLLRTVAMPWPGEAQR